jgi:hypothetical protein
VLSGSDITSDSILKYLSSLNLSPNSCSAQEIIQQAPLQRLREKYIKYGDGVRYFTESEFKKFEGEVKDGMITWKHTGEKINGKYIYVLGTDGKFYIIERIRDRADRYRISYSYHHSSPYQKAPILAAGEIEIKYGEIRFINNASGHFFPKPESIKIFLNFLIKKGYKVKPSRLKIFEIKGETQNCVICKKDLLKGVS